MNIAKSKIENVLKKSDQRKSHRQFSVTFAATLNKNKDDLLFKRLPMLYKTVLNLNLAKKNVKI